jgi:hypothetical protein
MDVVEGADVLGAGRLWLAADAALMSRLCSFTCGI